MLQKHLLLAINAAIEAGAEIMKYYSQGFEVEIKNDNTPVTEADKASNKIIESWLLKSGFPILSEEGYIPDYEERKSWDYWWCVDPLDGTKGFIKKNGEFAISIALMKNEFPVVGLIYLPTSQQIVFNWENEVFIGKLEEAYADLNQVLNGLKKATIRKRTDPFKVLTSRNNVATLFENHINDLKMDHDNIELVQVGSAIKFYRMAAGEANQYPRFQGSMEWDIAAGQAISEAFGFETIDVISKKRLKYNRPDLLNPHFIIRAV